MYGNYLGGNQTYPMLNPPAFINPYPAQPPLGMATGGYLPQQPSPVPSQQGTAGGPTLGMASGGYLPSLPQQAQSQQSPSTDILSMIQAYAAQQNQRSRTPPPARASLPVRANSGPMGMGLGSLSAGSAMPQMANMGFGFSRPGI